MIDDLERWKIKMCAGTYVNKRGECVTNSGTIVSLPVICDECPYDRI